MKKFAKTIKKVRLSYKTQNVLINNHLQGLPKDRIPAIRVDLFCTQGYIVYNGKKKMLIK